MTTEAEDSTRVESVSWEGDIDGELAVTLLRAGGRETRRLDRPGDLAVLLTELRCVSDEVLVTAASYGLCLASRGVTLPNFIPQIVNKTAQLMASVEPSSLVLYRRLEELKAFVANSASKGVELRREILARIEGEGG